MKFIEKEIDRKDILKKYDNVSYRDGKCYARVKIDEHGNEDPSCWTTQYRDEHEKKLNETKNEISEKPSVKSTKDKNGYFGMSRWNPLCWIIWILLLPFKILWWILKLLGLSFIISLFIDKDK